MIRYALRALLAALVTASTVYAPGLAFSQAALGITPCVQGGSLPAQTVRSMSVSTSSSRVQFGTCGATLIVYNTTSEEVFYNLGNSSVTASTSGGLSIPGGYYVVLNIGNQGMWFAAIVNANTTTLRFVQGRAST